MKKKLSFIKGLVVFTALILSFISCDKDYTAIGSDIIGNPNYFTEVVKYPAITYNKKLNPVQTNGLQAYYLGVYNDPIYGKTSASFVGQLDLRTVPTGFKIELDSVVLTIPYYSRANTDEATDANGYANYKMDSIYGNVDKIGNSLAGMKLSIYKNDYFLRAYDPNTDFESRQKYYSDGSTSEGSEIPQAELESELLYESASDNLFKFSAHQILLTEKNEEGNVEESERLQPSLRIHLDNDFWKETIIDKIGEPELSNTNNFQDYFRGLYFKLEEAGAEGSMGLLNIGSASLKLHYKSIDNSDEDNDGIADTYDADTDGVLGTDEGKQDTDGDGITDSGDVDQTGGTDANNDGIDDDLVSVTNKTADLSFSGNIINFFDNNFTLPLNDGDEVNGDEKLYLKGGEGSMAIIDLFGGDDLNEIRNLFRDENDPEKKLRLINEASLVFYEDESIITSATGVDNQHDYDRLYVYDVKNNVPLVDYGIDLISTSDPLKSVTNHLGLRKEDEQGRKKFKIRITEYVKKLIYNDSTNTKLGLNISCNVLSTTNASILSATSDDELNKVPTGAVLSQRGTILYGNNASDEEKKVKLEIYYTEPK